MAVREEASPFEAEWRAVEALAKSGEPFSNVETAIDRARGLDEEERAVLWLAGRACADRGDAMPADLTTPSRKPRRLTLVKSFAAPGGRQV